MVESLLNVAFISIFISSLLDAIFFTGIFLYGALLIGVAAAFHATGQISTLGVFFAGYLGSTLGSIINFYIGYVFGQAQLVRRVTEHTRVERIRKFLNTRGLFLCMLVGRFVGVFRPFYGLTLGTLNVDIKRFLVYEFIIGAIWAAFWTSILLFGENIFFMISGS